LNAQSISDDITKHRFSTLPLFAASQRLYHTNRPQVVLPLSLIDIAALYIDAQHGGAMRMQREGVPNETVANVLRMPLCTLVVRSAQ